VVWMRWRLGRTEVLSEIDTGAARPAAGIQEQRPPEPGRLSIRELCWLWRDGQISTHHPAGVELRGQVLDELEHRDSAGFARWLRTDALTSGDPWNHLGAVHDPISDRPDLRAKRYQDGFRHHGRSGTRWPRQRED
jgi:hypothetical protein